MYSTRLLPWGSQALTTGGETSVILAHLHYYPFDSGQRCWRDYITELLDSEAKFYFYPLSNYLWGLNDGLELQNRLSIPPLA